MSAHIRHAEDRIASAVRLRCLVWFVEHMMMLFMVGDKLVRML